MNKRIQSVLAAGVVLGSGSAAVAQPGPDYGFEWAVIRELGNAPAMPADYFWLELRGLGPIGNVDHLYRLAKTEVTISLWAEFARAFKAVYPNTMDTDINAWARYCYDPVCMPPEVALATPQMMWSHAARMCNWLHNGKTLAPWAFETGAYDVASWNDVLFPVSGRLTHLPGARFWIPTVDEWTKGMHYDPNKFGPGQPGYWLYPHSRDVPPVGGPPGTPGAETNAGPYPRGENPNLMVGQYPGAQSPWGLLDGSGCGSEWLEGWSVWPDWHPYRGSSGWFDGSIETNDRLDFVAFAPVTAGVVGVRLASGVFHCNADVNHDSDLGTDADIEAFFACLQGSCCLTCDSADFDGDGSVGTDADIDAFFRVLSGVPC